MIRFCAGVCVFGLSRSKVSSDGIGALSRSVSDVCMALQKAVGVVGSGAWWRRANIGDRASCRTWAAWSRVRRRYLFVHSICRCGVLPLIYGRGLWQKGQRSICSWSSVRSCGAPIEAAWLSAYARLHRRALVCDTAV